MASHLLSCIVLGTLTLAAAAGEPPSPSALPVTGPRPQPVLPLPEAELERALDRGIDFLLARQNANGSWGSVNITRPREVLAPVPGAHHAFRAAVTGLCISAPVFWIFTQFLAINLPGLTGTGWL